MADPARDRERAALRVGMAALAAMIAAQVASARATPAPDTPAGGASLPRAGTRDTCAGQHAGRAGAAERAGGARGSGQTLRADRTGTWIWLITALLSVASVSFTASRAGWRRAAGAAGAAAALGQVAEWAGVRTGFPFGPYRYTGLLRPTIGQVPAVVPVAWAGMALPAYAVAAAIARRRWARIAAGAAALTAWDLFLDPQMLRHGAWAWARPGRYRGVPASNFAGWLAVSAALMTALRSTLGEQADSPGLLATYTAMAVMETAGFAAVFEPDFLVAAVGGAGMGVPAAAAWAGRARAHG